MKTINAFQTIFFRNALLLTHLMIKAGGEGLDVSLEVCELECPPDGGVVALADRVQVEPVKEYGIIAMTAIARSFLITK